MQNWEIEKLNNDMVRSKDVLDKSLAEKRRLNDKLRKLEANVSQLDLVAKMPEYQQQCKAIIESIAQKQKLSKMSEPADIKESIGCVQEAVNQLLAEFDRLKRNGISTTKYVQMEKELKLLKDGVKVSQTLAPEM